MSLLAKIFSEALFLDTETTTARATPERPIEVIELAWEWRNERLCKRFKPRQPPALGALVAHGILMTELEDCPPAAGAVMMVPTVRFWIGHNIDFDWQALGSPVGPKRICTLALARWLWPDLDSHTLSACMYAAFGTTAAIRERLRSAHSAEADVRFVQELLGQMLLDTRLARCPDLDALWTVSENARVPTRFTFGKFNGLPISAADRGYAQWYRKQAEPDPYMLEAFKRAGLL